MTEDLEARGYSVTPAALPADVARYLVNQLALIKDAFRPASVGRGRRSARNPFVRRSKLHWIEAPEDDNPWANWTRELRHHLNRSLFLGLHDFESQFSRYDPGDFYKRHLDVLRGERNRVVSLVTYLNDGWLPDQGGELVLYPAAGSSIVVTPESGTLVLFMSEELPHEVLPTIRMRYGVAGWYRLDSDSAQLPGSPS